MMFNKLKIALAMLLTIGLLGVGVAGGLLPGDEVLAINGHPIPRNRPARLVVQDLDGPPESEVTLTVRSYDALGLPLARPVQEILPVMIEERRGAGLALPVFWRAWRAADDARASPRQALRPPDLLPLFRDDPAVGHQSGFPRSATPSLPSCELTFALPLAFLASAKADLGSSRPAALTTLPLGDARH